MSSDWYWKNRERALEYQKKRYDDFEHEKKREYQRKNADRIREKRRARYDTPDRPDGRIPSHVLDLVRIQCLSDGGDPGSTQDMTIAAVHVGMEFGWLGRSWLHPDLLPYLMGGASNTWRNQPGFKEKWLERFNRPG